MPEIIPGQLVEAPTGDFFLYVTSIMRGEATHFFLDENGYMHSLGEDPSEPSDEMEVNAPWCHASDLLLVVDNVTFEDFKPATDPVLLKKLEEELAKRGEPSWE